MGQQGNWVLQLEVLEPLAHPVVLGRDSITRNEISADMNTCEPIHRLIGPPTGTCDGLDTGLGDGVELFSQQFLNTTSTVPFGWEARTRNACFTQVTMAVQSQHVFVLFCFLAFWIVLCFSWSPRINEMYRREKLNKFIIEIAH